MSHCVDGIGSNAHLYDLLGWVPRIEIRHPGFEFTMDIDNAAKLKETVKVLRGLKHETIKRTAGNVL